MKATIQMKILIAAIACGAITTFGATIAINEQKVNQTIIGFGAFGGVEGSAGYTDASITTELQNLGATVIRINNGDAGESKAQWVSYINAYKTKAAALNEPLKFISTTWSPPASMKDNNNVNNGGHLLTSSYGAYANFIVDFLRTIKTGTGVDIYAVSLQNEPMFAEPYWSCEYSAIQMRDMVKSVVPAIRTAGYNPLFFMPEDMLSNWMTLRAYLTTLCDDTAGRKCTDAFACHGYGPDAATPASLSTQSWAALNVQAKKYGKQVWMTETSGNPDNWSGAYAAASGLYAALKYGNLSLWTWWGVGSLCTVNDVTNVGGALKQFYRYVRPGAVRIDAVASDSTNLLVTAFNDAAARKLTIVVFNNGASAITTNITGASLPASFQMYRSSSSQKCANIGTSGATGISFPASSITTLVGSSYNPPAVGTRPEAAPRTAQSLLNDRTNVRMYGIDGRTAGVNKTAGLCIAKMKTGTRTLVKMQTGR